jgi:hypothetical protein
MRTPLKKSDSPPNPASPPEAGKSGTWKTLGRPPTRKLPVDPSTPKNKIGEAETRIKRGETVKNPFGETLLIDKETYAHLSQRGKRKVSQLHERLEHLDVARKTIENPCEVWKNGKTRGYIRIERDGRGMKSINAVEVAGKTVQSWHINPHGHDHYREGTLEYVRL